MFDLQIDKKKEKQTKMSSKVVKKNNIVKLFYMWMFCITLKGRNTKRFHANHYATDAVPYFYLIFINVFNQNFLLSFNILFENKN
jgi:hypothetical protein